MGQPSAWARLPQIFGVVPRARSLDSSRRVVAQNLFYRSSSIRCSGLRLTYEWSPARPGPLRARAFSTNLLDTVHLNGVHAKNFLRQQAGTNYSPDLLMVGRE